jgi:hypothetical protein
MAGPAAGIDHVVIAVRDLARAGMNWTRLGFTLTPRGRHLQRGTANYCIMFAADYLELVGIVDPARDVNGLDAFLARREGIRGLAFAPAGDDTAAALAHRGLHPGGPHELCRQFELPEGTIVPRFRLVTLPPAEAPGLCQAFFCRHLTPELLRRPAWLVHPNGAVGLRSLTVLVEATAPLRPSYETLLGAGAVTMTDEVLTAHVGPHRLVFATPDEFSALYPEVPSPAVSTLPMIGALTLLTRDLDQTADHLTQWHMPYDDLAATTLLVPPSEANGATLIFQQT